jgi:hypothetical protein
LLLSINSASFFFNFIKFFKNGENNLKSFLERASSHAEYEFEIAEESSSTNSFDRQIFL